MDKYVTSEQREITRLVLENIQVIAKSQVIFYYGQTVVLENIQLIAKPHVSFYYGQWYWKTFR